LGHGQVVAKMKYEGLCARKLVKCNFLSVVTQGKSASISQEIEASILRLFVLREGEEAYPADEFE